MFEEDETHWGETLQHDSRCTRWREISTFALRRSGSVRTGLPTGVITYNQTPPYFDFDIWSMAEQSKMEGI